MLLSPYKILPNSHKRSQKNSKSWTWPRKTSNDLRWSDDLKRPQMTSNYFVKPDITLEYTVKRTFNKRNKNNSKAASVHDNIEITDEFWDKILHSNNLWIDLAMQIISNDQTVRNQTVQDLKDCNSQSLAKQAKKEEQLVSVMPAIRKAFDLMGDDIVELSTKNDSLKNRIGSYDEACLKKSKAKLLKQIDDEKRENLNMSRMQKQTKNH